MNDICGLYEVFDESELRIHLKSVYRDETYASITVCGRISSNLTIHSETIEHISTDRLDENSIIAPGVLLRYWVQPEGRDIALIRIVSSLSGMYRIDIADTRDGFTFEVETVGGT